MHLLIARYFFSLSKSSKTQYFLFNRYVEILFYGIILDIADTNVLMACKSSMTILQSEISSIELDITSANKITKYFRNKKCFSFIAINIAIDITNFNIADIFTLFFLCLKI